MRRDDQVKNKVIHIICLAFLLWVGAAKGQGNSLSAYDLKDSYLEKRGYFLKQGVAGITRENQDELGRILKLLEQSAPDSYEYHLIKYIHGNHNLALKEHLFKAKELRPDATELKHELYGFYVLTNDKNKQKELSTQLIKQYSKETLAYYRQVLKTAQTKFLIFGSDEDAYPAMLLLANEDITGAPEVINLNFLYNDAYRKKVQSVIGGVNMKFAGNEASFVTALMQGTNGSVGISVTVSQSYFQSNGNHTFLTGLVYQDDPRNQYQALQQFWATIEADFLNVKLENRTAKALYGNYLPALFTLYKLNKLNGNDNEKLREAIVNLAEKINKEEAVGEVLKRYDQLE